MPAVPALRQTVNEILDQLPTDATIEDLQYHLYVRQKIERGLQDIASGSTISDEDMGRRIDQWAAELNGPGKQRTT